MIKINIVHNDSRQVAKVVIIDDHNRVLMLKRSNYMDKYAGEWDLPGGHIKVGEDFLDGMKREVKEGNSYVSAFQHQLHESEKQKDDLTKQLMEKCSELEFVISFKINVFLRNG